MQPGSNKYCLQLCVCHTVINFVHEIVHNFVELLATLFMKVFATLITFLVTKITTVSFKQNAINKLVKFLIVIASAIKTNEYITKSLHLCWTTQP